MKNLLNVFVLAMITVFSITSCSDDDAVAIQRIDSNLTLNFEGLEDLGADYAYEGWIIVNGQPVTTGIFRVDANGQLSQTTFTIAQEDLDAATAFVLTIEPSPDADPAPSDVHILAGNFQGNNATLTVDHGAAIGNDFTASTGKYILATPTDGGSDTNENSGVWWLDPTAGPGPGLDLPTLPAGWIYEGWAVIDGTPVSTGRFTAAAGSDDFNGFSGTAGGPPFPGEDFLTNAPEGLDFPLDLSNRAVVISIEPVPDNSPAPFTLKPLVATVPANAVDHTVYDMANNAIATNPTGTVNIAK